MEKGHFSWLHC